MEKYDNTFKVGDTNSLIDISQIITYGINIESDFYWIASRIQSVMSNAAYFDIYTMPPENTGSGYMCFITSRGTESCKRISAGFFPVFTLKSSVKITGGTGTEEDPYTLGV